ncbi:peptidyl-prolyl cis-trans isomerase [Cytophagales bacterium RKSG123]|nr:peptidyl-prolyl cis-trans isomerase [Xanthovirga aplysinae]
MALLFCFLVGCNFFKVKEEKIEDVKKVAPIARVHEKYLYQDDLSGIVPQKASDTDSTNIVERYVKNWVRKQLMIAEASRKIQFNEPELERKILDYRYALMIYEFEKYYINKELNKEVNEKEIEAYYAENSDNFLLKQNILQGKFVKLPKEAPKLEHFKKLFKKYNKENKAEIDEIKSYCYRFASFYSLEDSIWLDLNEVLQNTPLSTINDKADFLRKNRWVETSDDNFLYFLKIEDYKITNEEAPLEFVKDQITNIIINKRKVALSNQLEEQIYNRGSENNDFEIYIND